MEALDAHAAMVSGDHAMMPYVEDDGQEPCICCEIWVMDYIDNVQLGAVYAAWKKVLDLHWDELYPNGDEPEDPIDFVEDWKW